MHSILNREAETHETFQWKDQRNGLRQMPRRTPLHIEHPGQGKIQATMVDLSRRGMRLRSKYSLHCGDTMTIFPPEGYELEPLTVRVVRVQLTGKAESPVFDYGVHLMESSRTAGHSWFLQLCYSAKKDFPIPQV